MCTIYIINHVMVCIVKRSLTYNELHVIVVGYGAYSGIILWQLESINKIRDEVHNLCVVIITYPGWALDNHHDVCLAVFHVLRRDCENIQQSLTYNSDRLVYAIVNSWTLTWTFIWHIYNIIQQTQNIC